MTLLLMMVASVGWAQSTVLFHETFGDNSSTARTWDDSYSVKSGISAVYSGIESYTISNVKQGKNTTGSTGSGLNQSTQGTDAYIIIGPLNVANYSNLNVTYQWKAASIKGTYTTNLYYATSSTGSYTEVSGTGEGATSFVERSYSLPEAAQVSTLYLKIVWNTSNTQAIIDEVELTGVGSGSTTDPSITASDVNLEYNATSGTIEYSINNTVEGGTVSATSSDTWLTIGTVGSNIQFTCEANPTVMPRTATVTLTYTYNTNETVTKSVTVTQAGNPNIVDNISDITAKGTYNVQGTIVAKSQRGFIVGDGTGYVYYYNQDYEQANYNIGDKVKLSGSVVAYGGVFEFNNSTNITKVEESNYVEEEPTILTGANMDERVANSTPTQLSSYVQYQGILSVSDNHYNITNIEGATTAIGSISYPISTDFTSLNGKTVKVSGYYVGISSSKYYNTLIGSIEEVTGAAPIINAEDVELAYNATSGEIAYTISNSTTGVITATSEADWISNIVVADNIVTFTTTANEGNADRTATIILSYEGAEDKPVTVTQKRYVPDYAELPFTWDGGASADLLALPGVTASGLGSPDYAESNAPYRVKFDTTGDYIQVKTNERPVVVTIGVKMIGGANTSTITVQESANGEYFSDVQALTISGKQNDVLTLSTTTEFADTSRYVRLYFTKGSNVGVGPIFINAYSVTIGATGYGTLYYGNCALVVPAGVTAKTYKVVDGVLTVSKTYEAGATIHAATGVVLNGSAKTYPFAVSPEEGEADADNLLKGSDVEEETTGGSKYYALATNADGDADSVGFYWQAANGGAFTNGAHKAYLALPAGTEAKSAYLFSEDISTGINGVNKSNNADVRYNMQGQRVGNAYKGVVIKNGKKFLQK